MKRRWLKYQCSFPKLTFEYKGYMLNPDKKHVDLIIEGLKKKERYCPCRVQKIPENICCCTHFINDGDCCCKLWLKKED